MSSPHIFSAFSSLISCLLLIVSESDLGSEMMGLADKNLPFDTLEVPAIFHNGEND